MKQSVLILFFIFLPAVLSGCEPNSNQMQNRMPSFAFVEHEMPSISLEEALQKAAQDDKKILIDVYTDWCSYCRKMTNETYPDLKVQRALEEYFHYVRLDAESNQRVTFQGRTFSMRELAIQLGATGFPTTVFLASNGDPIGMQPGFIDARMFERLLVYVATEAYTNTSFDAFTID